MPSACGFQPLVETVLVGGSRLQALWAMRVSRGRGARSTRRSRRSAIVGPCSCSATSFTETTRTRVRAAWQPGLRHRDIYPGRRTPPRRQGHGGTAGREHTVVVPRIAPSHRANAQRRRQPPRCGSHHGHRLRPGGRHSLTGPASGTGSPLWLDCLPMGYCRAVSCN